MQQTSLFGQLEAKPRTNWRPTPPPNLVDEKDIFLDVEATGLRWWGEDRPVGISAATADGRSWYLPTGHAGGNLDEGTVKRWAREQLRGKHVHFFNGPYDIDMLYVWGIDLEAQGCTVTDLGFYDSLLDDTRHPSKLNDIAKRWIGKGKVEPDFDVKNIAHQHAADAAFYAMTDVLLLKLLKDELQPKIEEQGLQRVLDLENECLYVTCEMMRNGSPLNEEKLHEWDKKSEKEYHQTLWELYKASGMKVNPGSYTKDLPALFAKLGIPPPTVRLPGPDFGKVTFAKDYLKEIEHPTVDILRKAMRLKSLRSKYITPYKRELARDGLIRYSLHQLRVDDEGGTVSGRYSSSKYGTIDPEDGVNIQQVAGKKHMASMIDDEDLAGYVIRELYVPGSGLWLSADADQIEYRLFAHLAKPPKVLEAYANDPATDFHNIVKEMISNIKEISRELTKDINFAKLYGAGPDKIAVMLGMSKEEAIPFIRAYDQAFPEARFLLGRASSLAEARGYVKTMLGRRARFEDDAFTYAALNRVIQGTAADIMKQKLVELHNSRKETGFKLRFTVHDEVNGDVPDKEAAERVSKILNFQSFNTRVPITWGVGTGINWQEAKAA